MTAVVDRNGLLGVVDMKPSHHIVAIREKGLADANFILTNLMCEILADDKNKICLVITHNTIGHYHNIGRKMNYDIVKKIQNGDIISVEPLKNIVQALSDSNSNNYLSSNRPIIIKELFLNIKSAIEKLSQIQGTNRVYLIIDDISHLLDFCIDLKNVLTFINCCVNLATDNVSVVINCHVDTESDKILANALEYAANLTITVSSLKTGFSRDVSGLIIIKEHPQVRSTIRTYHYKSTEREIITFPVGDSLHYSK